MQLLRYGFFVTLLAPVLVLGQTAPNAVIEFGGVEYPALATRNFGVQFENGVPFGPFQLVQSFGPEGDGTAFDGCEPFDNVDDIAGAIAFVSRGACSFVTKAEHAANAGAVAVVIYQDDRNGQEDDTLVNMQGDCDPSVCSAPAVFVSRSFYKAIVPEDPFDTSTIITTDIPAGPPFFELSTGVVNAPFYNDGFFGAFAGGINTAATPFTFEGFTPLYVGTPLVGFIAGEDTTVFGSPYGESEYFPIGLGAGSFGDYDSAVQTDLSTDLNDGTMGVFVRNLAYGLTGDPFFFMQIIARSETGADIEDVYLGVFADFDIVDEPGDPSDDDLGGWNADLNMAYVFDADMGQYYGVMALVDEQMRPGSVLSGYSTDVATADDAGLYTALTTAVPPAEDPAERAIVVGQGPYTLPADSSFVSQAFAIVAGLTEAELFANGDVAFCRFVCAPAVEETEVGTYRLESVFPNPVTATATVGFTMPTAEEARVEVFDLLGRQVAILSDGMRPAGDHTVTLDATRLPSGVYVVRLATPRVTLTERVTVVR